MLFFIVGRFGRAKSTPRLMNRKHIAKIIFIFLRKSFFLMKFYEVRISSRTSEKENRRLVDFFWLVLIGFRSLLYGALNE